MAYRIGAYFKPGAIKRLAQESNADIASSIVLNLRSVRGPRTKFNPDTGVPVTIHAPYTINLASTDSFIREQSLKLLQATTFLADEVGAIGVTVHGGNYKGSTWKYAEEGWKRIVDIDWQVPVLVENAASDKRTCTGASEDIYSLFQVLQDNPKIGFTLDTAHVWALCMDEEHAIEYVQQVKEATSNRIWLIHGNGSSTTMGSQRDKHAPFADSTMPLNLITQMIAETECKDIVCETHDPTADIATLKGVLNG